LPIKRKRFSVEQIVLAVKQEEKGMPVAELIRRRRISEQTFYCWEKTVHGVTTSTRCASSSSRRKERPPEEAGFEATDQEEKRQ
jgi:hypothetical protein